MDIKKKIELLSPAGNFEKMKTALAFGADAVYVGSPAFSLRTRINDFDLEKIAEAAGYCHEREKKIYATVNIVAHNRHIKEAPAHIRALRECAVDALIVSDPGVLATVRQEWPEAEIHLSTQANCTNWKAAEFWQRQGVKRIILGRETTLDEIKEIHEKVPAVDLEYFVHGAMCMAYSGRCFLSKYFSDRSGNLGDCVQPCRWHYQVESEKFKLKNADIAATGRDERLELAEDEHGSYILNSKDLCLIRHLGKLADAGVMSFKIEGRAKSVYYQAVVAGIYSLATHNLGFITPGKIDFLAAELNDKLVHRGYDEGFLFGGRGEQNQDNSHEKCDWEFCGQVIQKTENRKQTAENLELITVKVHNSLKSGDEVEIVRPEYDIIKLKAGKMLDADTGEELTEAHGGQGQVVLLECSDEVPEYSVLRRKVA